MRVQLHRDQYWRPEAETKDCVAIFPVCFVSLILCESQPGDDVDLVIAPAKVEPEPKVPDDLRKALSSAPAALAVWSDTTAIARRDWITWMAQGKQAQTRLIRIEKMIDMLSSGKRRVCCFDRSGLASKAFCCPSAADDTLS